MQQGPPLMASFCHGGGFVFLWGWVCAFGVGGPQALLRPFWVPGVVLSDLGVANREPEDRLPCVYMVWG